MKRKKHFPNYETFRQYWTRKKGEEGFNQTLVNTSTIRKDYSKQGRKAIPRKYQWILPYLDEIDVWWQANLRTATEVIIIFRRTANTHKLPRKSRVETQHAHYHLPLIPLR